MTDKEKIEALFTELGIGFTCKICKNPNDGSYLMCDEGNAKIKGYCGFYVEFDFNKDGKFEEMCVAE